MKLQFNGYEIKVIWKLHRHKYYGAKHTSADHLRQGFPRDSGIEIDDAIDRLVKKQIIIKQIKTKEVHVCLNKWQIAVIHEVVEWLTKNMSEINKQNLGKIYLEIYT